jgi:large subunit ribosomal protein L25
VNAVERSKLEAEYRQDAGKGAVRKLRKEGKIPAIVYGRKEEPISLVIPEAKIKKVLQLHGESAIVSLAITGKKPKTYDAIVREVQTHPATGQILHVDFQRISLDEEVRVEVSVVLKGDPRGVKEEGGILEHTLRHLTITCVPAAIPSSIDVDVSELEIGSAVHVKSIIPRYPGIAFLDDPESTIAIVVPPAIEVKPEAEVEEEVAAEPELIQKEKKEEEEAEEKRSKEE